MLHRLTTLFQSQVVIGLVFSDESIRLVVMKKKQTKLSLIHYHDISLEQGLIEGGKVIDLSACKSRLKEAVRSLKIRGKKVVFAVPDDLVSLRVMTLPGQMTDGDIQNYLFIEVGHKVQVPFENPVFNFHVLNRDVVQTKILLVASDKDSVEIYRNLINDSGLRAIVAEINAIGFTRYANFLNKMKDKTQRMAIQLDKNRASVYIYDQGIPLFMHQIPIEKEGDVDSTEEDLAIFNVATEIDRVLNFYQFTIQEGEQQVSQIDVFGNHPNRKAYVDVLKSVIQIPVTNYKDQVYVEFLDSNLPSYYLTSLGLALKQVQS
ncbi:type IV pilus biogenesis protein PilM [Terrilactibacillus laevilacticus]|uniref:type IV pilus biogenesis protein PilM n=1 Tax=Terrilactibacillus laevilacticus TaxID=1380157 RepID=UPI0015EECAEF|nr:pilus assembly protein PilM [Terrilactibacillus laevilacticus]